MTREEKENLLREAVDILIRLDNHLMTSRENAEFSAWVEDLMENNCCEEHDKQMILDKIRAEITAIAINGQVDEHTMFIRTGEQVKQMALEIIDKYMAEGIEE